jgi:hypothetical protein
MYRDLIRLGALVMVLGLALDPFAQQLVQFDQHLAHDRSIQAKIGLAKRYSEGTYLDGISTYGASDPTADPSLQSGVLYGLVQPYDTILQQTSFSCPSGNCTWLPFESLAVCSVCNDIKDKIFSYQSMDDLWAILDSPSTPGSNSSKTTFEVPNGLLISNEDGLTPMEIFWVEMTSFGTGNATKTNTLTDNDSLIWAMSFLRRKRSGQSTAKWPDVPLEALECGLYYCVNLYQSSVNNGILQETEVRVEDAKRDPNSFDVLNPLQLGETIVVPASYWEMRNNPFQNLEYNPVTSNYVRTDLMLGDHFNVSMAAIYSISTYFQQHFKNSIALNFTERNMNGHNKSANFGINSLNGFYRASRVVDTGNILLPDFSPNIMPAIYNSTNLTETFRCIARSMSNTLRATDAGTVQSGSSQIVLTYYRVQWPWITLHAALTALGVLFLFLTIETTRRVNVPVWKSSSLAPIACARDFGNFSNRVESVAAMEERAKSYQVRLLGNHQYEHLVHDADDDRGVSIEMSPSIHMSVQHADSGR